jgi:hypothetical protein
MPKLPKPQYLEPIQTKELPSKSIHIPLIYSESSGNRYGIPVKIDDLPEHIIVP